MTPNFVIKVSFYKVISVLYFIWIFIIVNLVTLLSTFIPKTKKIHPLMNTTKFKKVPAKHEKTPEVNRVTKYLITPTSTNPNVLATVSTVAVFLSSFGSPSGTVNEYDYCIPSGRLPDSLKPDSNDPSWMNKCKKPGMSKGKLQFPTTAMCKLNEICCGTCYGFKYMFQNCHERKYCDYCLQDMKVSLNLALGNFFITNL